MGGHRFSFKTTVFLQTRSESNVVDPEFDSAVCLICYSEGHVDGEVYTQFEIRGPAVSAASNSRQVLRSSLAAGVSVGPVCGVHTP